MLPLTLLETMEKLCILYLKCADLPLKANMDPWGGICFNMSIGSEAGLVMNHLSKSFYFKLSLKQPYQHPNLFWRNALSSQLWVIDFEPSKVSGRLFKLFSKRQISATRPVDVRRSAGTTSAPSSRNWSPAHQSPSGESGGESCQDGPRKQLFPWGKRPSING